MNRRTFIEGAATAVAATTATIALPGEQERYLLRKLGLPKRAAPHCEVFTPAVPYPEGAESYRHQAKLQMFPVGELERLRFLLDRQVNLKDLA